VVVGGERVCIDIAGVEVFELVVGKETGGE